MIQLYEMFRVGKFIEAESRMAVAWGWGKVGKRSPLMGTVSDLQDEKVWSPILQQCEYT